MDKKIIEELKGKLQEEEKAVRKELETFASEDPNLKHNWDTKYPNREDGDKDDEADEVQEYDNMLALEHSLEMKLKDIKSALEKIENGTYGVCENCGKEISEERLLACPEAKTCLNCNKK